MVCRYEALIASRLARSRPPWKIGIETLGRMDAARLCQVKSTERSALSRPAVAVNMKRGKNSAVATPIWALAATTFCWPPAPSGRRPGGRAGPPGGPGGGDRPSNAAPDVDLVCQIEWDPPVVERSTALDLLARDRAPAVPGVARARVAGIG